MRARLALVALAALAVAGCGGSSSAGSSDKPEAGGASIVPADVAAYVSIISDLDSAQAKKADELLKKFPGREQLLAYVRKELADEGLSFDKDIRPTLGPEIDLVASDFDHGDASLVGLTKPKDVGKFVKLLKQGNDAPKAIRTRDDGWVVFGDGQAQVDRIADATGPKLDADASFTSAMGKLPDEALAKAWVRGQPAIKAISKQAGAAGQLGSFSKLEWLAAALEARDDGVSLKAVYKGPPPPKAYRSSLLDKVPAGTLLFLTFKGLDKQLGTALDQAGPATAQVEQFLGVTPKALLALFSGESVLYAGAGTPIPAITLVLEAQNAVQKLATLNALAKKVATLGGQGPHPASISGASLSEINFGPFSVLYGKVDGKIVVSDTRNVVRELGGGGQTLADDPAFKAAKDAAGMPDETAGFLYVNLKDLIPDVSSLAQARLPANVLGNLRPLRSLVVYAAPDGDTTDAAAFLEIR